MNNSIVSARVSTDTQRNAVQLHALEKSQRRPSPESLHFDYKMGRRWFIRGRLEQTFSIDLSTEAGMKVLAKERLALVGVTYSPGSRQSDVLEIRAASTPLARLVNLSRLGNHRAWHDVRALLRVVLEVKRTPRRALYVTEDRRLHAYYYLKEEWGITCDQVLVVDRARVLLQSDWLLT